MVEIQEDGMASRNTGQDQCGSRDEPTVGATAALTPEAGRVVYGRDGRCGSYVGKAEAGFYVRPIATFSGWDGEEFETATDAIEIWPSIYPKAPKHKLDAEFLAVRDQIAKAKEELAGLGDEKTEAQRDYLATVKELQSHEVLKNLLHVMRGEFTHVVNYGHIKTFEDACTYKDDYGRKQAFRLLSFAPDGAGKLTWNVNNWNDGSGTDRPVVLCRSEEEAKAAATAYQVDRLSQYSFEKCPHLWSEAVKRSREGYFELPENIVRLGEQAERQEAEAKVEKARAALDEAQAGLVAIANARTPDGAERVHTGPLSAASADPNSPTPSSSRGDQ